MNVHTEKIKNYVILSMAVIGGMLLTFSTFFASREKGIDTLFWVSIALMIPGAITAAVKSDNI